MSNTHSKPRRSILGIVTSTLAAAMPPGAANNTDGGVARYLPPQRSATHPALFGTSEFCRRLVRKNRGRRLGLAGQRL